MAVRKAVDLDPLSPFAHGVGALAMYVAGRHEEALQLAERALDLHPDFVVGLWPLAVWPTAGGGNGPGVMP